MYCAASTVHDFVELLEVALSNIICRGKKKEEMARLLFATACLCHMITGTLVHFGESFLSLVTFSHVISKLVVRVMMCCSSVVAYGYMGVWMHCIDVVTAIYFFSWDTVGHDFSVDQTFLT